MPTRCEAEICRIVIDLHSISNIAACVRSRAVSAREVIDAALDALHARQSQLNAFRESFDDEARAAADEIDRAIAAGESVGELAGVPIAVKDNIATTLGRTSCSSRFLEEYRSPFNATAIDRLLNAGAIIIGKTNGDEFGMGSSSEHCAFGPVRHPTDTVRVPGGSSGGSAAAVASGACCAALGSDTGGSVRQPAAFCGVVGLRPSYGRISRYGLVAYASSFDTIGPITNAVEDAAILLGIMAGHDPRDATSLDRHVPAYVESINDPLARPRVGVPRQFLAMANHPSVREAIDRTLQTCTALGAEVIELDMPLTEFSVPAYYLIAAAEASSNLARFDGVRFGRRAAMQPGDTLEDLYVRSRTEGFGPEVRRRIMLGTFALSAGYADAYYHRALKVRRRIRAEFDAAFKLCDVILGPTSPVPAFPLGEKLDPLAMYQCDIYTVGASLAGLCAISIPAGFAPEGGVALPIGIQFQCPPFQEQTLLRMARMFETNANISAPATPTRTSPEIEAT